MKKIVPYLIFLLILNSCAVLNMTPKDGSKLCDEHGQTMKKSIVKVHYGRACSDRNTSGYPNAKCVKCMGCVVRSPRYRYAIIWTCSTCTKLKRKHKREQMDSDQNTFYP